MGEQKRGKQQTMLKTQNKQGNKQTLNKRQIQKTQ